MKRIRVVQFGISHEHAVDKLTTIRALPDEFELVGLVDDRDGRSPRFPPRRPDSILEGVPLLTEEKETDGLCEHDLAVQRTLLRMVGLPVS